MRIWTRKSKITPNAAKIGKAVSYPGIDPRSWNASAILDSDSAVFVNNFCLLDCSVYGGSLDQNQSITARLATPSPYSWYPPKDDSEVILQITDGDPDSNPVVIGYLKNKNDSFFTTINDLPINLELEASTITEISPFDTEITVSPNNCRKDYDGKYIIVSKDECIIEGNTVKIHRDAIEPLVLGNTQLTAIDNLMVLLGSTLDLLVPLVPPTQGTIGSNFQLLYNTTIKPQLQLALSQKTFTK